MESSVNPVSTFDLSALSIWATIIAIGIVTFFIRFAPIVLLSRLELPEWLKRALRFVPPAVMTAIIVPALFFIGSTPTIGLDIPRLIAAALAALVAWKTRSTLLTVVLGMFTLWGLQALLR